MSVELAELAKKVVAVERAGGLTMELADGTLGYLVRAPRRDDCWQAAVATCLQVPIEEVPDLRLHERAVAGEDLGELTSAYRLEFFGWLTDRGLRMVIRRRVPVAKARWIGVVPTPGWAEHCMVMRYGRVLFDPTKDLRFAALAEVLTESQLATIRRIRVRVWGPEDVGYGLSFRPLTKRTRRRK
jgi:hypothetical protein